MGERNTRRRKIKISNLIKGKKTCRTGIIVIIYFAWLPWLLLLNFSISFFKKKSFFQLAFFILTL
jgi:hypothetical protein